MPLLSLRMLNATPYTSHSNKNLFWIAIVHLHFSLLICRNYYFKEHYFNLLNSEILYHINIWISRTYFSLVSEFVLNMYYYQLGDLFGKLKLSLERMQGQITRMSNGFCTEVWLIEECFQWLGEMNRSVRSCSFKFCGWKEVSNNAERCKLPLTKKIYFLFRNCFGTFTLSKKIKFQKCFG